MSRSIEQLLREALAHFDLANGYALGDTTNQMIIDAICMRLSAGIEVLARLDPAVRGGMFGDTWQFMWGMRNRIAHGYLIVDAEIVRATLTADLPEIVATVRRKLGDPAAPPERSRT